MPIILDGTTGITTPGITNTGEFVFQGPIQVPAGSAASASVTTAAGPDTGIYFPSSSSIAITTAGTERFIVSASGNVGIGTSSPVSKLNIVGALTVVNTAAYNNTSNYNFRFSDPTDTNKTLWGGYDTSIDAGFIQATLVGTAHKNLSLNPNGGNVGIGTTSPVTKLHTFNGSSGATGNATLAQLIVENSADAGIQILCPNANTGRVYFGNPGDADAALIRWEYTNNNFDMATDKSGAYIRFLTDIFVERARITSDGKFCIGDTSSNYLLRVGGAINNNAKIGGLTIGQSASEYPSAGYNVRFTTTINTYNYDGSDFAAMIRYAQNDGRIETFTAASGTGGNQITFTTGPYVANLGTSWTNSSDERLKNITGEIQNGLAKVCSLRAAEFTWKDGGDGRQQVGLIAQDVLKVLPEVVVVPEKEFDGTAGTAMGVNYDQTIPLLVAAIKELKAELDALKGSN